MFDEEHTAVPPEWKQAFQLAAIFALIKLVLQVGNNILGPHLGYGYFRDELYFLICGHHLAWGYVDQPPMVALQARVAEIVFGKSVAGVRMLTAIAGALKVALAGLLTWALGGKRVAQCLAMVATLLTPVYLVMDSYLNMNTFEPVFWMGSILAVILMARGGDPRWWIAVGLLGGLGLENKHSTTFFLIALLFALLISPQRSLLRNRWFALAVLLVILIALPNLLWEWRHHWATYELLNNIAHSNKNVVLGPGRFLLRQVLMMAPLAAPLWIGGLLWLLFSKHARAYRFAAVAFLGLLAIMIALKAKDYYVAPMYPLLLSAGAVGLERLSRGRRWPAITYSIVLVVLILPLLPLLLTLLPPDRLVRYQQALHFAPPKTETEDTAILPQYFADRIGWPEMVAAFARGYNSLSPQERVQAGIICGNYGEASAVNFLGGAYGLPTAISGHQNYFYWGPHGYSGEVMLAIGGDQQDYEKVYQSVEVVAVLDNPYTMPYERRPIFLCRHRKGNYAINWNDFKKWM